MIYLLTAIGLPPGGSRPVHIYTQTVQRTTKKLKKRRRVLAVPCLCELYPGICLITEEKPWKNLSGWKNLSQLR
jgi:hypothetical protein